LLLNKDNNLLINCTRDERKKEMDRMRFFDNLLK